MAPVYRLDGVWKSDWERTRRHIEADCKLAPKAAAGLERLMGKMTVTYSGDRVAYEMPEIRFAAEEGEERVLPGWRSETTLTVLGRTRNQVAILDRASSPPLDEDAVQIVTFDDADIYWLYVGHSPLASLHVREYFRRVTPR